MADWGALGIKCMPPDLLLQVRGHDRQRRRNSGSGSSVAA